MDVAVFNASSFESVLSRVTPDAVQGKWLIRIAHNHDNGQKCIQSFPNLDASV
jgi:hypothetical protein